MDELPATTFRLVGFCATVKPLGELASVTVNVPENPLMLVNVIVELPELPTGTLTVPGEAETEKSITFTVRATACDRELEVPVIVTV